ncbi:UNVERIFIED_CONTAM: hypothetical protein RMT77_009629 [Armadillidium vulgare]
MLKFSTIKFILLRKLMLHRCGSFFFSTRKLKEKAFLQTIGSGAYGAPQSLLVQSHSHKLLFNCGEGTKRIALENNIALKNLAGMFFTSCSWRHVSGIPALLAQFSISEEKNSNAFNLYGPPALENFLCDYSKLDNELDAPSRCSVLNSEEVIFNESLVVKPVPLFLEGSNNMSSKDINSKYILAYICTFPTKEEILSTNKLISTGVPPEPSVGSLKDETPVELSIGKLITPPDDLIHSYKESTCIVLEIPSVEYLESLISSSDFDKYKKEGTCNEPEENDLKIIVHFSPPEVMKDSRYRQWVNSFSPSVSHLVINSRNSCLGLHSPVIMQLQLHQILPNVFPLHCNPGVPFVSFGTDIPIEEDILIPQFTSEYKFDGTTIQSSSALLYHIKPFKEFDSSSRPFVNPKQVLYNCQESESILNSIENLNAKFAELNQEKNSASRNHYPSFLFLGTGSSFGTGTRNNSGILISLCQESCVLLDCGEGTLNQLIRFLGKDETMSTLRKLKLVFISHRHQDHHIGLIALLNERKKAFMEAGIKDVPILYILAPQEIIRFVNKLSHNFSFDFENILFINNYDLSKKNFEKLPIHKAIKSLQLEQVTVVNVPHLDRSFGVALTHKDGWKVVYSGDTAPSTNLISIGKNCDLLIHEATFEDGMEERAFLTCHTTFSQAIHVGEDMNAKFTILTHFSQRYPKIPLFEENTLREKNVGIAFDCMKVTFEDFPYLRHLYPTLKEMFSEDYSILKRKSFISD